MAVIPLLGTTLIGCWLTQLSLLGVRRVTVYTSDRSEAIRAVTGDGSRWGMEVDLVSADREWTEKDVRAHAGLKDEVGSAERPTELTPEWTDASHRVVYLDHLPGQSGVDIYAGYSHWFQALMQWLPSALTPDRVGIHEIRPGIYAGAHTRIPANAQLIAPCWIGDRVFLGSSVVLGPQAVVEDGAEIKRGARVFNSFVGPETFVGRFTDIGDSLALGDVLVDWKSGSSIQVRHRFLLGPLRPQKKRAAVRSSLEREGSEALVKRSQLEFRRLPIEPNVLMK